MTRPEHARAAWLALTLTCVLCTLAIGSAGFAQDAAPLGPIVRDGLAQDVPEFKSRGSWHYHQLWVETEFDSDGNGKKDRVHVTVARPGQSESGKLKLPVIYETSPYFTGIGSARPQFFWNPRHELGEKPPARAEMPPVPFQEKNRLDRSNVRTWVRRGFAVVHSSSPGTGQSQGCATIGGENESLAPKAVIDWLNGRARGFTTVDGKKEVVAYWSNGKVAMTGVSYNGTLPLAAATTGVDGLLAVIPRAPNTSYYHYYRSHGLVRHPGGYMGEDADVLYDFINSGFENRRDWCNKNVRDALLKGNIDRRSGDWNEFWAERDYLLKLDKVKAACLMVHAFNDWNVMPEHTIRIYEALKKRGVPHQLYMHQGGHDGFVPEVMMNRWITRYVLGVENGVEAEPRAHIVRVGDSPRSPTAYPDYPHPAAKTVKLLPRAGGLGVGELSVDPQPMPAKETLVDNFNVTGAELAVADESKHRLLYASKELTAPLHISGTSTLEIEVASNRPAANLSVWLVSLPWTRSRQIADNVITRGWADPQNHESISAGKPLEPGRFYRLRFTLQPDDQIIPAGQRIGLMVFSSDRDFTLWPKIGTELTVDLSKTVLELPIVGGADAWREAIAPR